jgi:hypothetical protein
MSENETTKLLQDLELPEIQLPANRQNLKTALLTQSRRSPSRRWYIPAGLSMTAAIVLILVTTLIGTRSPQALAQETVRRMFIRLESLSPAEREQIERRLQADLENTLLEAQAAGDLITLDREQFEREVLAPMEARARAEGTFDIVLEPGASEPSLPPPPPTPEFLTYLRYTNAAGQTVIVGVDENNLPVMKLIRLAEGSAPSQDFFLRRVPPPAE